jgi:GWxTD domain-containing protein
MRVTPYLLLASSALLLAAAPAQAQKLDKDDKKFLDEVKPILLPDEEKTFRKMKDKGDRQEFQKIFWARRDPDLDTADNEYRVEYEKAKAEADAAFKVTGVPGSLNDCGRLFIVLGKPDEVKKEAGTLTPGARSPEVWTYRDRPGLTFTGGQAQMALDAECRLPSGSRVSEQLDQVASNRIANPNIDYRTGKDGKLTKLADLLPKPTPARALLKEPRQDFPATGQAMFLKVQDGGTAVLGVVRAEPGALPVEDAGGRKVAKVVVAGSAVDGSGKEAGWTERSTVADVQRDGSVVAAFRMSLRPGSYTLKVAILDGKGTKGSVADLPIEVPDYGTGELGLASLMVLRDVVDLPGGAPDSEAPFAAFQLGAAQLVPFGTTVISKSENPWFFYQAYDLKVDEATGKASGQASVSVLKASGAVVANAPPVVIETPVAGSAVGPVPFEKYEPGLYKVKLTVSDKVAKKEKTQEVAIEIKP